MGIRKANKMKLGLYLLLFTVIIVSMYSIWNYHGGSEPTPGQGFQHGRNIFSYNNNQTPQGGRMVRPNGNNFRPNGHVSGTNRGFGQNRMGQPNGARFGNITNSNLIYATPLLIYSIFFFSVFAALYYLFVNKQYRIQKEQRNLLFWTILGVSFFLRIAIAPWVGGHPFDINLFKEWATSAAGNFSGFYLNSSSDYPPFYVYILFLVGKAASLTAMSHYFTLLIKLPSILADVATGYILYRLALKYLPFEISLLLSAFYIFNPAIFINSTFWGQVDSFFALLIVTAIFTLSEKKLYLSAAFFTIAVLMKPQGLIFLPVLLFEIVRLKDIKRIVLTVAACIGTALLIILPFSFHQEPLWIIKLFSKTIGEYPYGSVNAFNFFSLIGANYQPYSNTFLGVSYHVWGMVSIVIITMFSWFIFIKGRSVVYASIAALLQIAGVFTFSTSMHERYLFPAVALSLLAFIYAKDKRLLWLAAGFSVSIFINTYAVFYGVFNGSRGVPYNFTLFTTSLFTIVLFIYLVKVAWDIAIRHRAVQIDTANITGK